MEELPIILCIVLILLLLICHFVFIGIIDRKRKRLIDEYERLLNLKDWLEKIADEASHSYIMESVEERGNEFIKQFNLLNVKLKEIQEQHKNLQEQQRKLHNSLLEEQKILNQYFENYS